MMLAMGYILAAALALAPAVADAACPVFESVVGTSSANTLRGKKAGEPTKFRGRGGRDTFVVEKPQHFAFSGCTDRDHWDVILDFQAGETIDVPGTPSSFRLSGCRVWWGNNNYVILGGCPDLRKADVRVR